MFGFDFSEESFLANLNTPGGAAAAAILFIVLSALVVSVKLTHLSLLELLHHILLGVSKFFARFINKREEKYHRDVQIGKITEKRMSYKMYRFLHDLIIDLNMKESGITPYELLFLVSLMVFIITTFISRLLFGSWLMTLVLSPLVLLGTFCTMYTKANVAHDTRIENVLEAENIICNNIKVGVLVAVRESLDVLPKGVRQDFQDFVDNVEQKNYHIKTALLDLNSKLGSIADDFIKKCIVFEMEEEHGIAGMFADVVEINNIKMEMRTNMKRKFEEVKSEFIMGASMIFIFLFGVIAIYPNVREFYFTKFLGHIVLCIDILLLIAEYVFITYLRAREL